MAIGIKAEIGTNSKNAIAIGSGAQALAENSISIGNGNIVKGKNSGAIGDPSIIDADNSYSIGNNNTINKGADNSFVLGNDVNVNAKEAVALGNKTSVTSSSGVAIGANSVANRANNLVGFLSEESSVVATTQGALGSVSVGNEKETRQIMNVAAGTNDSDAVNVAQLKAVVNLAKSGGSAWISSTENKFDKKGNIVANNKKAEATGVNSVAVGAGSKTVSVDPKSGQTINRHNTVSIGTPGNERTISNVAPGVLNSDAATMGQLRSGLYNINQKVEEYHDDAMAGTAAAMAIGNLPQATIPGKGMMSMGGGYYEGESAMALGLSKMSDNGKWVVKGSASYDSQSNAGAALSVGFHF